MGHQKIQNFLKWIDLLVTNVYMDKYVKSYVG